MSNKYFRQENAFNDNILTVISVFCLTLFSLRSIRFFTLIGPSNTLKRKIALNGIHPSLVQKCFEIKNSVKRNAFENEEFLIDKVNAIVIKNININMLIAI